MDSRLCEKMKILLVFLASILLLVTVQGEEKKKDAKG